jgi:glycerophosphoryl diester phosphodiesterase
MMIGLSRLAPLLAVALVSLAGGGITVPLAAGGSTIPDGFDLQGHRGCAGLMPENTLPAFERALELGVTTLELDLQLTRDDVVVVHHDPHLAPRRCVDSAGRPVKKRQIDELAFAELEPLDCGASPVGGAKRVAGAHIPRLEQVLDLARDADYPVRVNIEIKKQRDPAAYRHMAELVVEALRERDLLQRAMIQSFEPEALIAVREIEPELTRAALVRKPKLYTERLEQSEATVLQPRVDLLRENDVRRIQAMGVRVIPWTVNKAPDMRRLIAWGVDGMITDYPDRALSVLQESD